MKLSQKYGISEETIKKMIKDGVISNSWNAYERVAELKKSGKSVDDIMFETGYSKSTIYYIINRTGV